MTSSSDTGRGRVFADAVVTAVLGHMNGDHGDDNLLIARAFAADAEMTDADLDAGRTASLGGPLDPAAITASRMIGFDGDQGVWQATLADSSTVEIAVPWLSGPISERPEVRREIVALYDEACRRLGIQPRAHG